MKNLLKRLNKSRLVLLIASLSLLLMLAVGATLALLLDKTDSITNTFTPTKVDGEITEEFEGNVKNNVQVKNNGDIDAYIRAYVVVTWQNYKGEVYPTAPVEGTDYTVSYPENSGWFKHNDGFYYYTEKVASGASTGILLTDCKPVEGKAPDGYHLVVEILSSAIQADPDVAIRDAWDMNVDENGKVVNPNDSYPGGMS